MDEILALLGDHSPCLLFELFFLKRLPEDFRTQLVDAKIVDHWELARRAEVLWSVRDIGTSSNTTQKWPPAGCKTRAYTVKKLVCILHTKCGVLALSQYTHHAKCAVPTRCLLHTMCLENQILSPHVPVTQ